MSVAGRKALYCFVLVFLSTTLCIVKVKAKVTTCNLISEGVECVQHCEQSKTGKEDCSLSYKHNASSIALCSQVCDPKDNNGKKCSLHCDASEECIQQCGPGHCRHMKCYKSDANCEQYCTKGGCMDMVCNSRKCFQNCRNGGCKMKCGQNVEYCEQICPGGQCSMKCEAKVCRAYCPLETCHTQGPNSKIMTECKKTSKMHSCVQDCPASGCYCKAEGRVRDCKQACGGGRDTDSCSSITCHSQKCKQHCGSNCSLTCSADHCLQECKGSGCQFQCSENVQFCKQICLKGNCVFNCAATKCRNACPGGKCTFNRLGDAVGSHLDAKCDYRHNGQCEPLCKECVHGGHDLKCAGGKDEECLQVCLGGRCKNVKCLTKKICRQSCAGGLCDAMECKSNTCLQRCPGGRCAKLRCDSEQCTQTCLGSCKKMICNSKVCHQDCFLGGCSLECGSNVSECNQKCYSGRCSFKCHAKKCVKRCPEGKCPEEVTRGMGRVTAADHMVFVTGIISIFLYINL